MTQAIELFSGHFLPALQGLTSHGWSGILASQNPVEEVRDKAIWSAHGWWLISNNSLSMLITAVIMLLIFPRLARVYRDGKVVATGTNNLVEAMLVYVREDMIRPILGDETDRFIPYLWTLFFFILINNLLGLLPLTILNQLFLGHMAPFGGTASGNIWVTGALALLAFIVMQISGIRSNGFKTYFSHFLGGAPIYMAVIMIPIEILGMIVKPCALAIRLFANMTAGHMLLAVLLLFTTMALEVGKFAFTAITIPVILGSVAIMCLELFAALLQAYIFTFLTALFIGQLVIHEHKHKEGEGGHHDEKHEHIGSGDLTDGEEFSDATRQAASHMAG